MSTQKFESELGGRKLIVETGKLAPQVNGSCTVQYGETVVLATAVMSEDIRDNIDYLPLMVDYEEKLYAAGKIKGSRFIKREGRATDEATISGRFIDRAIRPLFDDSIRNDIQVVLSVLSWDGENDADVPALIAAITALTISDIPWKGPLAGLRVGRVNGNLIVNPTYKEREEGDLDLVIAGTADKIIMIEGEAKIVPEKDILEAIWFGQKNFQSIIDFIEKVKAKAGKEKMIVEGNKEKIAKEAALTEEVEKLLAKDLESELFDGQKASKKARRDTLAKLEKKLEEYLTGLEREDDIPMAVNAFYHLVDAKIFDKILNDDQRVDQRKIAQIRQLSAEVGLLPRVHGTGLFERGETHVLSVVTLGAPGDEQTLDSMEFDGKKRYFHHYNFPPFSVNEAGPMRGPGRRDIGHGTLAEKALLPVLPTKEIFPYTIRVVSEVLSSNGSSSMGSVCGSTLSLMDAGVPITSPVAGIAMGLAWDGGKKFKVLTDLQDLEDGKGGMDFKVAGTKDGITAIQMDTKTDGLIKDIVEETVNRAYTARLEVLDVITKAIPEPRKTLSPYAPKIIAFKIPVDRIREVIGPGGKIINGIIDATGVTIDIDDDGTVSICCKDAEALDKAVKWVKDIVHEVKAGEVYTGKVTRLMNFGAFVEILPNQEGLVHISEMANYRVNKVEDVVKVGDEVTVKVIKIDEQNRINLSMKAMLKADDLKGHKDRN